MQLSESTVEITLLISSQANGGEVLPLEKTADVKIVDHARKEAPPGSYVAPQATQTPFTLGAA